MAAACLSVADFESSNLLHSKNANSQDWFLPVK
jgi:hypothetical protein